jgi:hypothetical protein
VKCFVCLNSLLAAALTIKLKRSRNVAARNAEALQQNAYSAMDGGSSTSMSDQRFDMGIYYELIYEQQHLSIETKVTCEFRRFRSKQHSSLHLHKERFDGISFADLQFCKDTTST